MAIKNPAAVFLSPVGYAFFPKHAKKFQKEKRSREGEFVAAKHTHAHHPHCESDGKELHSSSSRRRRRKSASPVRFRRETATVAGDGEGESQERFTSQFSTPIHYRFQKKKTQAFGQKFGKTLTSARRQIRQELVEWRS
ncbi:hypothetical protein L1887_10807 [Cichorium endivia]|nr:hypothetical protein L1887_10807 [Cichorium endivia]